MEQVFQRAANALDGAAIRYVLGGGFAVNVHGFARGTKDIDLLIAEAGRETADAALRAAGFTLFRSVEVVSRYEADGPGSIVLDVMPLEAGTFEQLWAGSVERPFLGRSCKVLALQHLLAMKIHAMRHDGLSRGLKDLLDVAELARLNGLKPDASPLKDICLRFGTPEILDSIRKALESP